MNNILLYTVGWVEYIWRLGTIHVGVVESRKFIVAGTNAISLRCRNLVYSVHFCCFFNLCQVLLIFWTVALLREAIHIQTEKGEFISTTYVVLVCILYFCDLCKYGFFTLFFAWTRKDSVWMPMVQFSAIQLIPW